jgi:4-amino-4-deoxy-L-arabinose transferase-like glycosyltransferase
MVRASATRWFRLRLAFALGVLVLLVFELFGHRSWLVVLPQALLIVGIIITSALDLRDLRRRRAALPRPPSE